VSTQSTDTDRGIVIGDSAVLWIAVAGAAALLAVIVFSIAPDLPNAFFVRGYGTAIVAGSLLAIWPARGLAIVDKITKWLAVGGGFVLIAIMLLTVVDVTLRKLSGNGVQLFNLFLSEEFRATIKPIKGATELAQMGLAIVVACSLGYGARTGAHVAVDILGMVGGRVITRWTDIFVRLLGISVLAPMVWRLYDVSGQTARYGLETAELHLSHGPFYLALSIGAAVYLTILVIELFVGLHTIRAARDPSDHN